MEAKFTVKWASDVKDLRKSFAEVESFQKKEHKTRTVVKKTEDKAHNDALKRVKVEAAAKTRAAKQEENEKRRLVEQHTKLQLRSQQKVESEQLKSKKKLERDSTDAFKKKEHHKQTKFDKASSFAKGAAGFAIGGAVGMIIGAAVKGYQSLLGVQSHLGGSIGIGYKGSILGNARRSGGAQYGYNAGDVAGMMPSVARSTGAASPDVLRKFMATTRATGMDGGEVGEVFGAIRQAGTSFAPQTRTGEGGKKQVFNLGVQEFQKIQSAAMYSGLEKSRFGEFASGISQLLKSGASMAGGAIDSAGYSKIAAMFGKLGGEGFRGRRGMERLSQFDQALMHPGGGDNANMALMEQGFGTPGSGVGFWKAQRQREQGLRDPANFSRVMEFANKYSGGDSNERAGYLQNRGFASSLEQADKLQEIFEKYSQDKDSLDTALKEFTDNNKSVEEQARDAMKESATMLGEMARKFDHSIEIGEKSVKTMLAIEHMQEKFVDFMFNTLPAIAKEIHAMYMDLRQGINAFVEALPGTHEKVFDSEEDRAWAKTKGFKVGERAQQMLAQPEFNQNKFDPARSVVKTGRHKGVHPEDVPGYTPEWMSHSAAPASVITDMQGRPARTASEVAANPKGKGVDISPLVKEQQQTNKLLQQGMKAHPKTTHTPGHMLDTTTPTAKSKAGRLPSDHR